MNRTQWTFAAAFLLMAMAAGITGCDEMTMNGQNPRSPLARTQPSANPTQADYVREETVVDPQGNASRGATDVAMEYADKYAQTAKELLYANQRIGDLEKDKKKLQTQIAALKSELAGYQRELNDANVMLSDMKKDLKEWRANVLGIRKDFLASQNAILASQYKILELLGGEVSRNRFRKPAASAPRVEDSPSRIENPQANLLGLQENQP